MGLQDNHLRHSHRLRNQGFRLRFSEEKGMYQDLIEDCAISFIHTGALETKLLQNDLPNEDISADGTNGDRQGATVVPLWPVTRRRQKRRNRANGPSVRKNSAWSDLTKLFCALDNSDKSHYETGLAKEHYSKKSAQGMTMQKPAAEDKMQEPSLVLLRHKTGGKCADVLNGWDAGMQDDFASTAIVNSSLLLRDQRFGTRSAAGTWDGLKQCNWKLDQMPHFEGLGGSSDHLQNTNFTGCFTRPSGRLLSFQEPHLQSQLHATGQIKHVLTMDSCKHQQRQTFNGSQQFIVPSFGDENNRFQPNIARHEEMHHQADGGNVACSSTELAINPHFFVYESSPHTKHEKAYNGAPARSAIAIISDYNQPRGLAASATDNLSGTSAFKAGLPCANLQKEGCLLPTLNNDNWKRLASQPPPHAQGPHQSQGYAECPPNFTPGLCQSCGFASISAHYCLRGLPDNTKSLQHNYTGIETSPSNSSSLERPNHEGILSPSSLKDLQAEDAHSAIAQFFHLNETPPGCSQETLKKERLSGLQKKIRERRDWSGVTKEKTFVSMISKGQAHGNSNGKQRLTILLSELRDHRDCDIREGESLYGELPQKTKRKKIRCRVPKDERPWRGQRGPRMNKAELETQGSN